MATLPVNLKSLTIPQLITLCREHKISGYSKLKKAALIDKLEALRTRLAQDSISTDTAPSVLEPVSSNATTALDRALPGQQPERVPKDLASSSIPKPTSSIIQVAPLGLQSTTPVNVEEESKQIIAPKPNLAPVSSHIPDTGLESTLVTLFSNVKIPVRRKSALISDRPTKRPRGISPQNENPPVKALAALEIPTRPAPVPETGFSLPHPTKPQVLQVSTKRFVPLKPKGQVQLAPNPEKLQAKECLDGMFACTVNDRADPLPIITIPPSLSQRNRLKIISLMLRDISDLDRRNFCQTGRLGRYAGRLCLPPTSNQS